MKVVAAVLLAAAAALGAAECPSSCSGHGTCGVYDNCECYMGYMGGDCALRACPQGLAWADTPVGDLNHDGIVSATAGTAVTVQGANTPVHEYFPLASDATVSLSAGEAHLYAECSGKGACDRASGQCACADGYTGHACQRATCPNDCSGNGVCYSVGEIAAQALNKRDAGSWGGVTYYAGIAAPVPYRLWDADARQACVCDAGFAGHDCSLRACPRGDDPLTTAKYSCGGVACAHEVQTMTFTPAAVITASGTGSFVTMALNYTHWDGAEYASGATTFALGNGGDPAAEPVAITHFVKQALLGLPNAAVTDVAVSCTTVVGGADCRDSTDVTADFQVAVTFRTPSGDVAPLKVHLTDSTPGAAQQYENNAYVAVATQTAGQAGNTERVECSNRGVCHHGRGECSCFPGYTGPACSTQNALSTGNAAARQAAAAAAASGSSNAGQVGADAAAAAGAAAEDAAAARERRRLQRKRQRRRRR